MTAGELIVAILVGLVGLWALLIAILWLFRPREVPLRELLRVVPDVLRLVRDLIRDPAVPRGARAALVGLLAWLISPIDLIPEVIPVLGPLDDVVVAVLVLRYVRRRVGEDVMRSHWQGSEDGWLLLSHLLGGAQRA
ncbi:MAG TPA: DUF1232 domain-containing protein [Candidatus Limnocylindria bacterium]|nr:DUF1232 domain-containing protein [Candidatus Limnocylindria bacterium]